MDTSHKIVLQFERFCLDLGRGSLRSEGKEISLRPKSFEVLSYLALNAGRLVSKQELDEAVWPNTAVTDASLTQCIRELREKLDDSQRTLLKTLHRRGYILDTIVTSSATDATITSVDAGTNIAAAQLSDEGASEEAAAYPRLNLRSVSLLGLSAVTLMAALFYFATPLKSWRNLAFSSPSNSSSHLADLTSFQDCEKCPQMVVLPRSGNATDASLPSQRASMHITLTNRIAVGRFEVTVAQFEEFVSQSKYPVASSCMISTGSGSSFKERVPANANFRNPGLDVGPSHPVSCVNWYDAKAYVAWLERKTGKLYRLLTDLEWEYAARAGTAGAFSFPGGTSDACQYVRFADLDSSFPQASSCHSGRHEFGSLPVGSLKPNAWGLHDVHGNVWEWVEDCAMGNLGAASPSSSLPARRENCEIGIARGGGFGSSLWRSAVSFRLDPFPVLRHQTVGFRVALSLD